MSANDLTTGQASTLGTYVPAFDTSASLSRANTPHAINTLFEQLDPDETPALLEPVKDCLVQASLPPDRPRSLLLGLPTELIIEIANFVLDAEDLHDKKWFAAVLPLMQTCRELRKILHPVRPKRLVCHIECNRRHSLWGQVFEELKEWHGKGSYEGVVEIFIDIFAEVRARNPDSAAAMAGALESAIYGRLLQPPCVYIKCLGSSEPAEVERSTEEDDEDDEDEDEMDYVAYYEGPHWDSIFEEDEDEELDSPNDYDEPEVEFEDYKYFKYFVGHDREASMIEQSKTKRHLPRYRMSFSHRVLRHEEGGRVWQRASTVARYYAD